MNDCRVELYKAKANPKDGCVFCGGTSAHGAGVFMDPHPDFDAMGHPDPKEMPVIMVTKFILTDSLRAEREVSVCISCLKTCLEYCSGVALEATT